MGALLKHDVYSQRKQNTFLNSSWLTVLAASAKIGLQANKDTDSIDVTLIQVIEKKFSYIGK